MELHFDCPRCDSLHQVRRPLDSLREHIARVHLDLAMFFCPRCNLAFYDPCIAHHHIRKECQVLGVLEAKDYTRSLLGMDATYLAELHALVNEAVFTLFHRGIEASLAVRRPPSPGIHCSDSVEVISVKPGNGYIKQEPQQSQQSHQVNVARYSPGKEVTPEQPCLDVFHHAEVNADKTNYKRTLFKLYTSEGNAKRRKAVDDTAIEEDVPSLAPLQTTLTWSKSGPTKPPTPICHYLGCPLDSCPHRFPCLPFVGATSKKSPKEIECVCASRLLMPRGYRPLSDFGGGFDMLEENVTEICVFKNRALAKGYWIEARFSHVSKKGIVHYWLHDRQYSDLRCLHPHCIWRAVGIKEKPPVEEEERRQDEEGNKAREEKPVESAQHT